MESPAVQPTPSGGRARSSRRSASAMFASSGCWRAGSGRLPRRGAARRMRPRVCLLADAGLFDRDGIYGDRTGAFGDNAFRFATLSSGALSVAERAWDGALPDIVVALDWHAALSILYARHNRGAAWGRVSTLLTIHNLAFQGVVGERELDYLAIPRSAWQ